MTLKPCKANTRKQHLQEIRSTPLESRSLQGTRARAQAIRRESIALRSSDDQRRDAYGRLGCDGCNRHNNQPKRGDPMNVERRRKKGRWRKTTIKMVDEMTATDVTCAINEIKSTHTFSILATLVATTRNKTATRTRTSTMTTP